MTPRSPGSTAKHDDDCEHGPTRRPLAERLRRLASWRKVSLNPAFRPA